MSKKQIGYLKGKIKQILKGGGVISVYGWISSNHSKHTRAYAATGRIKFLDTSSKQISNKADFVIFTNFINHSYVRKLRDSGDTYPHCITIGAKKG